MGGIVVISDEGGTVVEVTSDEGGTVVGDVENLKISRLWTFEIFVCLWWVELFRRLNLVRRRRDVK